MKIIGEGYFLMCLMLTSAYGFTTLEDISDVHDICRFNRHVDDRYMKENNSFQLHIHSTAKSNGNDKLILGKHRSRCILTFKACSSCHITVLIRHMDIPSCSGNCSCNHFEIQEPLSGYTSHKYCGYHRNEVMYFESRTKIAQFDFVQSVHKKFYVSLTFNVSSNVYIFTESSISHPRYIESPYFPANYPSDYSAEYHFQALSSSHCVQLLFLDFRLSQWSYVEVQMNAHSGTKSIFHGDTFRPPVIVSKGPSLSLKFEANQQVPSHGFRALYTFSENINGHVPKVPNTSCGGAKEESSGILDLSVEHLVQAQLYDCIWLIFPPSFSALSYFLSALLLEFRNVGPNSSISFRGGLTSKSSLHSEYVCKNSFNCTEDISNKEIIVPAGTGLYVRFQGDVMADSRVKIQYHMFRKTNCTSEEFLCNNARCINIALRCDGYEHCSDGSDELNCKPNVTTTTSKASADIHSVYQEPIEMEIDIHNGFITLMFLGSFGIFVFTVLLTKFLCKLCRGPRIPVEPSAPENISVVSDSAAIQPVSRPCTLPRDGPPSYEHVITFSERYPPLFYTRTATHAETCMSDGAPCQNETSQGDKSTPAPSECEVCSSKFSHATTDSLVINFSANSERIQSLGVTFLRKHLTRSVSVDSAINNLCCAAETCVNHCYPNSLLGNIDSTLCDSSRPYSQSVPCGCYFAVPDLKQQESLLSSQLERVTHQTTNIRSHGCSFVTNFPTFGSSIILSLRNNSLQFPIRKKTYSF